MITNKSSLHFVCSFSLIITMSYLTGMEKDPDYMEIDSDDDVYENILYDTAYSDPTGIDRQLKVAACKGDMETIKSIFEDKKKLYKKITSNGANNALKFAALGRHVKIFKYLLIKKTILKHLNIKGIKDIFGFAATNNHHKMISHLTTIVSIMKKVKTHRHTRPGDGLLDIALIQACAKNHLETIQVLINNPTIYSALSEQGIKNALSLTKDFEIIRILKSLVNQEINDS